MKWCLGVSLMVAIGLAVCLSSCSQGDAVKAAGRIHAYLPTVMALTDDVAAVVAALDPSETAAVRSVSARVKAELLELQTVSGAYASGPSADGWSRLEAVVDSMVSDADEGLVAALEIQNPDSQARAKLAMSGLDAAVHVLDGYLAVVRSAEESKVVAGQRAVKLERVARYWSRQDWQRVEQAFGARGEDLAGAEMRLGF